MRNFIKFIIFLTISITINTMAAEIKGGKSYEIPSWFTNSFMDMAEDAEDAQNENKTVLLYFHLED